MSSVPSPQERTEQALTLPQFLRRNAHAHPERAALREKEFGLWQTSTWADYAGRVEAFALGLEDLGFDTGGDEDQDGDVLAVLADNRPEWLIAELAVQSLGRPVLGLYQDSVAEEVQYLLEFAGARFVVAEDQEQVDKLLGLRAQGALPELRAAMSVDKKARGATLRFVVLDGLARPTILSGPAPELLDEAYRAVTGDARVPRSH